MPTEAEIEAAARAMAKLKCERNARIGNETLSDDAMGRAVRYAWSNWVEDARAALTAAEEVRGQVSEEAPEPFVVKHYVDDLHPTIKGNGFDGLVIGDDREEAEDFIGWVNARIALARRGAGQAVPEQRYPIRQEASGQWTTSGMSLPAMDHAFPPGCETFGTAEAAYAVCYDRNGYVRPDLEAAIRADERERCKRHTQKLSSSEVMINADMARRAPKPEDKP